MELNDVGSGISQRIKSLTIMEALELCFFEEMLGKMPHEESLEHGEVIDNQGAEVKRLHECPGFSDVKVLDAASAYGTMLALRRHFAAPESFSDGDVFNRIAGIVSVLTRHKGLTLDEMTKWLNESGIDANFSHETGDAPDNVISMTDFLSQKK